MDVEEIEAQVAAELGRLQERWAGRDALIREMRELRFMETQIAVPEGLESDVVRTPVAYQVVERMVGALFGSAPQITVPPTGEGDLAVERASKLERWTSAALWSLQRQSGQDVVERFGESLLADGHGAMRLLYAPRIWEGYPRREKGEEDTAYSRRVEEWKRGRELPLVWTWVDPLTVYPVWDERGLALILEHGERDPVSIPAERFNRVKEDPEIWDLAVKPTGDGMVAFTQRWASDGTLGYFVNGRLVHWERKTRYVRPPYVYAFGVAVARPEPEYAGLSTLYPLRYLLPYLDRLLTQKATAIRIWAWPTPVVRTVLNRPLGPNGLPLPIEIEPGKSVTLFPGEDISFLVWAGSGPEMDSMVQFVYHLAERAGISDVLYGAGGSGQSGYLVSQLIAAAKMKFRPIVQHTEQAMESLIGILWDIVERMIRQKVYVFEGNQWYSIGPSDIGASRMVRYTIQPVIPTDEYARSSMTINEVAAGLRSLESGMERIGIEQPDEEQRKILVEGWKKRPEVQAWLTNQALKRAGMLLDEQKMVPREELENQMQGLPDALVRAITGASVPQQGSVLQEQTPPAVPLQAAPGVMVVPKAPGDRVVQPAGVSRGRPGGPHKGSEES